MPELAEVEACRVLLETHLSTSMRPKSSSHKDLQITNCICAKDEKIFVNGCTKPLQKFMQQKGGAVYVERVLRKAKFLIIVLLYVPKEVSNKKRKRNPQTSKRACLVAHLGMTGSFVVKGVDSFNYVSFEVDAEIWPPRFTKFELNLANGEKIAYVNARRFGRLRFFLCQENEKECTWEDAYSEIMCTYEPMKSLAPDALLEPPTAKEFYEFVTKKTKSTKKGKGASSSTLPIKNLLMNQNKLVSGLGNWMCDEICYQAKMHPETRVANLSLADCKHLLSKIKMISSKAVAVHADYSKFPKSWLFHVRWGKKGKGKNRATKDADGNSLKFIQVGGRTTCYVPKVQLKSRPGMLFLRYSYYIMLDINHARY
eukprot:g3996.t1